MTLNQRMFVERITATIGKKPKTTRDYAWDKAKEGFTIPFDTYLWENNKASDDDCLMASYSPTEDVFVLYYPSMEEDAFANIVTWCGRNGISIHIDMPDGSYVAPAWLKR